ncbi:MAG: putative rhodanese-related sulfurtransferase [Alphaproteobacteria bacterium ADurb.Bin438]|nr:MAG: putative rhodanese-related sulfurtransferase [Alphaproteobacteria bacterium ADurb.Bin438]
MKYFYIVFNYIFIPILFLYAFYKVVRFIKRKRRGPVNYIKPHDLKKRIDNGEDMLIVDTRKSSDFKGMIGHIEGAINIPYKELEETILNKMDKFQGLKDTPIVVTIDFDDEYGYLSYIIFLKYGFKQVYLLDNGLSAWIREGFYVTKDASHE